MNVGEKPICFDCAGENLVGIVHRADKPTSVGVVIVVGGPQYRVGAHRQFVLAARSLARAGISAFRFDVRGMGDSSGDFPGFEAISDDIGAAIDAFIDHAPGVQKIVLWGLCDGASASLFYAHGDRRVAGVVLLNPWVRTDSTYAKTELRHYYTGKVADWSFWRRLLTGDVDIVKAGRSLWQRLRKLAPGNFSPLTVPGGAGPPPTTLPDRMQQALAAFDGPVLLIMSGKDLTAREFDDVTGSSPPWTSLLARENVTRLDLPAADHTFSREEWTDTVNDRTAEWVARLDPDQRPAGKTLVRTA